LLNVVTTYWKVPLYLVTDQYNVSLVGTPRTQEHIRKMIIALGGS